MAAKQKILSIRMHKEKWRQWRKLANLRGLTLTRLVETAVDKELSVANLDKQAIAPERLSPSA